MKFTVRVEEGKAMAKASLQAVLDVADATAHTMLFVIAIQWSSWLQALGLPLEIQQTIQDFPFEGSTLFSEQTASKLHSLKDSQVTSSWGEW